MHFWLFLVPWTFSWSYRRCSSGVSFVICHGAECFEYLKRCVRPWTGGAPRAVRDDPWDDISHAGSLAALVRFNSPPAHTHGLFPPPCAMGGTAVSGFYRLHLLHSQRK